MDDGLEPIHLMRIISTYLVGQMFWNWVRRKYKERKLRIRNEKARLQNMKTDQESVKVREVYEVGNEDE